MYKEVLSREGIEQPKELTLSILTYGIGDIHKMLVYMRRFGNSGFIGELKVACADAMTMLNLFCEQVGYNIEEISEVGLERFRERVNEVSEKS